MSATDPITRLNAALSGRYSIVRQLGEGGMATVYLADDLKHERKVALKVLKPELAAVVGAERFLAEIKTTANLQHPHILPLFDSGEADKLLFYVMPHVEGESLRDRLDREHQLPVDEAVRIATAVAQALDYAHRHGVIHRDIKPANVLMHDGQPVISDFGIALAVSVGGAGRLTETGLSLGTPHYMSPEQATGDVGVGPATDIWALGCVLYEMLVGEPPYIGSTPQAVIGKIVLAAPASATAARKSVPSNVEATIRKALEKLPADRFGSASEFARALADPGFRHGADAAGVADPGRWRTAALAGWGTAALATVLAGWALARPGPSAPVSRYSIALPADQALASIPDSRLALTPDGQTFVYSGARAEGGFQLWMRPRDRLLATPLPGTEGAYNPAVSPDGSRVAFVSTSAGARRLMVASLGGAPPLVLEDSLVDAGGVSWGFDGYIYYDGHLEGDGLARVPEGGGRPEAVTMPRTDEGEASHNGPEALPGGMGVLFQVRRGTETDVAVVDLRTGEHTVLVAGAWAPRYSRTGHLLYVTETGTLVAAPFDEDALALTGDGVAIADGVTRAYGRTDLALAADGTLMYSTGGSAESELVRVGRDGAATEVDPGLRGAFQSLALSPDGSRLAVSIARQRLPPGSPEISQDVWIKQLDRGPLSRLTFEGAINSRPAWPPDGRTVSFSSDREGLPLTLWTARADGSGTAERVLKLDLMITYSTWSPDGQWVVVRRGGPGVGELFALRPGVDSVARPILATRFDEQFPELSTDGRWLAYVSNESGRTEVYVRPFPDVEAGRWQVSTAGGSFPLWAHGGGELFYVSGSSDLMAVEVGGTTTFQVGAARVLFPVESYRFSPISPTYAVTPDDQHFIMMRASSTEVEELIVVEKFFEELRARVPN